jgi:hypothetical protein
MEWMMVQFYHGWPTVQFDDGVEGLVPFLLERTCPMVAANLDITAHPELRYEYSYTLVNNKSVIYAF